MLYFLKKQYRGWGIGFTGILIALIFAYGFAINPMFAIYMGIAVIVSILVATNLKLGLYLVVFIAVFGQFLRFRLHFGGGIMALDILVGIMCVVFCIKQCTYYKSWKLNATGMSILGFLAIGIISLLFGSLTLSPGAIMKSSFYLIRLICYCSLFFIARQELQTRKDQKNILAFILFTGVILCIAGFVQLWLFPDFLHLKLYELGWDPHINRLTSTWLDPNFFGGYLVLLLMFSIPYSLDALKKRNIVKTGLYGTISLLFLITLFYTLSRSSYLAFLVGLSIIGILKARKFLIIAFIVGILVMGSSQRLQERVNNGIMSFKALVTNSTLSLDPTAKLRVKSWKEGYEIWKDNPFLGVGYNTLRYENEKRGYAELRKHSSSGSDSSLLTILETMGIFGGIMFLFLLFTVWYEHGKRFLVSQSSWSLGIASSITALFLHSFLVNTLLFPFIITLLLIIWGTKED